MKSKLIGAGLIAGATWVAYNRLSEPTPFDSPYADAASQILIVGGGFGGLAAARELGHALGGRQDVGVALLDRVNYMTFWPLVPSVISTNVEVRHVAHSIRPILKPLGVLVDEFLRVKSRSGVYAVEDFTSIDYNGPPVPALAQAAEQEGKSAALNLAAEVKGEAPVPFCYRTLGQLVDLGEDSALVNILGTKASGLVGALIWKGVYLYELDLQHQPGAGDSRLDNRHVRPPRYLQALRRRYTTGNRKVKQHDTTGQGRHAHPSGQGGA